MYPWCLCCQVHLEKLKDIYEKRPLGIVGSPCLFWCCADVYKQLSRREFKGLPDISLENWTMVTLVRTAKIIFVLQENGRNHALGLTFVPAWDKKGVSVAKCSYYYSFCSIK